MNKTVTFVGTLAFTLAIGFSPLSLVHAQKNKILVSSKLSANDLPKISVTSSLGVFYSDFSAQNISKAQLVSRLSEWLGGKTDDTFKLVKSWNDEIGIEKTMFQHYYNGIKVQDDVIIIHEKDGKVISVNGEFVKNITLPVHPQVSVQELKTIIGNDSRISDTQYITLSPEENVISKKETDNGLQLNNSTMVSAYSSIKPVFSNKYYIDNVTKQINNRVSLINHDHISFINSNANIDNISIKETAKIPFADTPSTSTTYYKGNQNVIVDSYNGSYRLKDNARKVWTLDGTNFGNGNAISLTPDGYVVPTSGIVEYTNPTANFTSAATKAPVEVHWAIQKSNDYYLTRFNRNNFDGLGTPIANYYPVDFSIFNQSPPIPPGFGANAAALTLTATTGQQYHYMAFGNGGFPATPGAFNTFAAVDVGGHEYSHLVVNTNGTGGLTYQGESGALNEGFADILGASIEFYAAPTQANWTIGEGIPNFTPGYLRSMSAPKTGPAAIMGQQPDTYPLNPTVAGSTPFWASTTSSTDNGGVHINSGIPNKWFYLLSVGGSGTNDRGTTYSVTGLTIQKAEQIAYKTLTGGYLTPNSNFLAAYNASKQAAIALYGAGTNELQQVENAWCAVGVGNCASLLSVNDLNNSDQKNIKIYPNPVIDGQLTIESNINDEASFEIYDLSGKLIKKKEKLNKGINKIQTNGITKGLYIIKINSKDQIISKKVLFN